MSKGNKPQKDDKAKMKPKKDLKTAFGTHSSISHVPDVFNKIP
jgi:hypothetical protein